MFSIELRLEKMEDNMLRQVKKGEGKSVTTYAIMNFFYKMSAQVFYCSILHFIKTKKTRIQ